MLYIYICIPDTGRDRRNGEANGFIGFIRITLAARINTSFILRFV